MWRHVRGKTPPFDYFCFRLKVLTQIAKQGGVEFMSCQEYRDGGDAYT